MRKKSEINLRLSSNLLICFPVSTVLIIRHLEVSWNEISRHEMSLKIRNSHCRSTFFFFFTAFLSPSRHFPLCSLPPSSYLTGASSYSSSSFSLFLVFCLHLITLTLLHPAVCLHLSPSQIFHHAVPLPASLLLPPFLRPFFLLASSPHSTQLPCFPPLLSHQTLILRSLLPHIYSPLTKSCRFHLLHGIFLICLYYPFPSFSLCFSFPF